MTTDTVANEFVALSRQGKFAEIMARLLSVDIVRIAPAETAGGPGGPGETRGNTAVMANSQAWTDENEVHSVQVDGPFVGEGRFAVRFAIDATHKPTGERTMVTKMSLYTVVDGKVVREEVYYAAPPPVPSV